MIGKADGAICREMAWQNINMKQNSSVAVNVALRRNLVYEYERNAYEKEIGLVIDLDNDDYRIGAVATGNAGACR